MLDPPFLELEYYVGSSGLDAALQKLTGETRPSGLDKFELPNAVGLSDKPEEVEITGGILVLRTEGEAFCGPERNDRARLRKLGRRVYQRFVEVADVIPCAYGAILVEYSLEEPEQLRRESKSIAFRNFFLSRSSLGEAAISDAIRIAGEDAYVERRESGVYISMTSEFNPEGRGIPWIEAQERSVRIASVVGKAVRWSH